MTEIVIVFAVNVLTSVFKRWIEPKWGRIGVQISVFVLALIGAVYVTYGPLFASIQDIVTQGLIIFSLAITFYEVVLNRIALFKGN